MQTTSRLATKNVANLGHRTFTWTQAARRSPMTAVPIASVMLRNESRTILHCTILFSIESSCVLPFASCQCVATSIATVKAKPTDKRPSRGKDSRQSLPLAASIHVTQFYTLSRKTLICRPAVPQVRARSLCVNLGGETLSEVFLDLPDPAQSIPTRFPQHRSPVKSSGESYSTSSLPVLSPTLARLDSDGDIAV